ncbi:hypothetical protein GCM10022254_65470 [Actinomadura meridiana]|uniref:Uncharacterized protein n=1 Tax=Actinomadura meridiana TaxID=559626 RepID=A0ABP8CLA2_9ACTN
MLSHMREDLGLVPEQALPHLLLSGPNLIQRPLVLGQLPNEPKDRRNILNSRTPNHHPTLKHPQAAKASR